MKKKIATANKEETVGFRVEAASGDYCDFRKLIILAQSDFFVRYLAAHQEDKASSTEALREASDEEFYWCSIDALSTQKRLLARRMGDADAEKFISGIVAYHAVIKSGIGKNGPDMVITATDVPDRLKVKDRLFALGSLRSVYQNVIANANSPFKFGREEDEPACPPKVAITVGDYAPRARL